MYYWSSFYLVFASLLTVTYLGCLRKIDNVDNIINAFAAMCYAAIILFPKNMRHIRYLDWLVTCPLLLVVFLRRANNNTISYPLLLSTSLMIVSGYLGKDRVNAWFALGAAFYVATFVMLYRRAQHPKNKNKNKSNNDKKKRKETQILFWLFAIVWGMYAVGYLLPDMKARNITYNTLDLISKVGFAIFLIATHEK